jgi:hypothetical protein
MGEHEEFLERRTILCDEDETELSTFVTNSAIYEGLLKDRLQEDEDFGIVDAFEELAYIQNMLWAFNRMLCHVSKDEYDVSAFVSSQLTKISDESKTKKARIELPSP